MNARILQPALLVLLVVLASCQHVGPGEGSAGLPAAGAVSHPARPAVTVRRPDPPASLLAAAEESLPLPVIPELRVEGLSRAPLPAVRRPVWGPDESVRLPEPVALAAPPRVRSAYALIERALSGSTVLRRAAGSPPTGPAQASEAADSAPQRIDPVSTARATSPSAVPSAIAPAGPRADPPAGTPAGPAAKAPAGPPAGAPAKAPAAPSPEPGAAAPREAGEREIQEDYRQVLARVGDPIELSFEGEGWLFTSAGQGRGAERRGLDGLDFQGSASERGRTRFTFLARGLGEYLLSFQLQDHRTGALRNEVVRLRVLDEEAFARALQGATGPAGAPEKAPPSEIGGLGGTGQPPGGTGEPGPAVPRADRWFELREYELALSEYLKAYRPGDPYLNERIADSYAATGEHLAAAKYYQLNLQAVADYHDRAVQGLVRCGLALGDEGLLADAMPVLLSVDHLPIGQELIGLARFHMERNRPALAMTLLQEYERRYGGGPGMDEVLYRMAQLYESESPLRDLRAAREMYRRVYDGWPESPYSEPAHRRLLYLERHFFDVR